MSAGPAHRTTRGQRRASGWFFAVVQVLALVAVPVLAYTGFRTVLDTTEGQAVDPELDPDQPGYEAFLSNTPVALAIGLDEEGGLSWLTAMALSGPDEEGGAVLFVPAATFTEAPGLGEVPLTDAYASGGEEGVAQAVADLLGVGFDEVVTLDPTRVAALFEPVAPLALTLPEAVADFDGGEQVVPIEGLVELLGLRVAGESDLARLARHELVVRAWLDAVGASTDPNVVPGETTSGIGRFVRGLAAGPTTIDVIPVDPFDGPLPDEEVFAVDAEEVQDLVGERVPFPTPSHPGARARVRVLDAVGSPGLALRVARDAALAGGQVTVVGNADTFGRPTSSVVFFDEGVRGAAEEIAAELGVADVRREDGPNPNDTIDLTVVVGTDLGDAYGGAGG